MSPKPVLVVGTGHLASRVRALVTARGLGPVRWDEEALSHSGHLRFEIVHRALSGLDLGTVSGAILVDEEDERNLELAIALIPLQPRMPIVVSMFNEKVAPQLQEANPYMRILIAARIAAPSFVAALVADGQ